MKSMSMCVGRVLRSATTPRAKGAPWRAAHTASAGFVSVLPPRSSSAAVAVCTAALARPWAMEPGRLDAMVENKSDLKPESKRKTQAAVHTS